MRAVKRGHAVSNLRLGNDHHREGFLTGTVVARVAHDADDLPGWFLILRPNTLADDDLLADGVFLRPILLRHGLVNQHHARCAGSVAVSEVAAAQDRNPEKIEIPGRRAYPSADVPQWVVHWLPDDAEVASPRWSPWASSNRSRVFNSRNRVEPLAAIADQLRHPGGLLKAVAGQRHFQCQHVVRVKAVVYLVQRQKCPDQKRGADQQHHGQRDLADHQQGAGFALLEASPGYGCYYPSASS